MGKGWRDKEAMAFTRESIAAPKRSTGVWVTNIYPEATEISKLERI